jgi:hypothetical protein
MIGYYPNKILQAYPDLHSQTGFYHDLTNMIQEATTTKEYAVVAVFTFSALEPEDEATLHQNINSVLTALLTNYRKLFKPEDIIGLTNLYAEFALAAIVKNVDGASDHITLLNKLMLETCIDLTPTFTVNTHLRCFYRIPNDLTFADNLIDCARKSNVLIF